MLKHSLLLYLFLLPLAQAKSYQLKELIELAKTHPELKIEQFEVEKARVLFDRIRGETGPKLSLLSGLAPNKSATGTPLASAQSSSVDTISYLAQVELKWPIYMFNRSEDLKQAATGNLKVKEIDLEQKEAQLIKKIKEYYYAFQFAASLNEFANDTLKDLDSALADMKKSKKQSADDVEKLALFRSLAQVKKYEIERGMAQGLLGLKFITQTNDATLEQDWIEFSAKDLPSLATLTQELPATSYALKQVELGAEAKKAFLKSEKKALLPTFGLFLKYDWMSTDKSTPQPSKFAYDPYNRQALSVGAGFIWDFDWGIKSSKVAEAQIDLTQIQAKRAFAQKNLPLQIEKIYLEVEEAQKKASELERAYKSSKKIFNRISTGVVLGVTPAKDIIESYTTKAQVYQQMVEAFYNYEVKLAELSYETGRELDPSLQLPLKH